MNDGYFLPFHKKQNYEMEEIGGGVGNLFTISCTISSMFYIHIFILLGNAVTSRRIYSILLIRVTVSILLPTGLMECD